MTNRILVPDDRALAEEHDTEPAIHHQPEGFSDRFALELHQVAALLCRYLLRQTLRPPSDRAGNRRGGPGHGRGDVHPSQFACAGCKDDEGWIRTLLEEAENERMHLMTFIEIAKPTLFERLVILMAQWVFLVLFSILYLFSSNTAHRVVGYFEEEAVISYTLYLKEIDEGRSPNVPAPAIARHYWKMADDATLRDVVLLVRADEAHHRDVNHGYSSKLGGTRIERAIAAPYPLHADDIRVNA